MYIYKYRSRKNHLHYLLHHLPSACIWRMRFPETIYAPSRRIMGLLESSAHSLGAGPSGQWRTASQHRTSALLWSKADGLWNTNKRTQKLDTQWSHSQFEVDMNTGRIVVRVFTQSRFRWGGFCFEFKKSPFKIVRILRVTSWTSREETEVGNLSDYFFFFPRLRISTHRYRQIRRSAKERERFFLSPEKDDTNTWRQVEREKEKIIFRLTALNGNSVWTEEVHRERE